MSKGFDYNRNFRLFLSNPQTFLENHNNSAAIAFSVISTKGPALARHRLKNISGIAAMATTAEIESVTILMSRQGEHIRSK